MRSLYHSPVKRSVTIAGHPTSLTLEPIFWRALELSAEKQDLPISAIVAQIDAERLETDAPPNLASAIRTWLYGQAIE